MGQSERQTVNASLHGTKVLATLLVLVLIGWLGLPLAHAQSLLRASLTPVTVCPVAQPLNPIPDFQNDNCEALSFWEVDPQGQHIWMRAHVNVPEGWLDQPGPKGLTLSGMAASEVFLNGERLGGNGQPGDNRATEIPGLMDAVFHAPNSVLRPGENEIIVRLSSHHGAINLASPLHLLGLGTYEPPAARILSAYWPALIMLGVFGLGTLVFAVMAIRSQERQAPFILALMSLMLGAQLLIEASRGLFPYLYPFHVWRLVSIVGAAYGTALCLIAYMLARFSGLSLNYRLLVLGGSGLVLTLPIIFAAGFDGKAGRVLELTLSGLSLASAYWVHKGHKSAIYYLIGLSLTLATLWLTRGAFLDLHLYWIAALFLLIIFVQQALTLIDERKIRLAETERAQRLDAALVAAQQRAEPTQLELISSGRTQYARSDEITQLKGAGDYVEICFKDGRTVLHTGTLAKLEQALPGTFLRVHRSHIVNTAFVVALEREPGGAGRLILNTGSQVPVSRRILPKVKTALAEASV